MATNQHTLSSSDSEQDYSRQVYSELYLFLNVYTCGRQNLRLRVKIDTTNSTTNLKLLKGWEKRLFTI